ncbi:glycosyltransferase 87 family protein [Salinimicrobium soli]|uniref:glycosyltransferase 87 family protein n=1 Tax=Salinimicrobium soli TaxID=1254399 RepID=UPI003AAAB93A
MKQFLNLYKIPLLLFFSGCVFYWAFAYDLERSDFVKLCSLYAALFFASWKLFQMEKFNIRSLFGVAIIFRLIFLFSLPNLSQDYFRFIWDGRLLLEGINPYLSTPQEWLTSAILPFPQVQQLIEGMGSLSAGNHTNYPPLNQLLFALSAFFGGKSILGTVIAMRTLIIGADIGIFYLGRKLLRKLDLPENRIFWYLLNPFVIIELTGNLHFEGVMLFFLLGSLYLLHQKKWFLSAILLACSVSLKLIPLLFLPLFFRRLGLKKALFYYLIVGGVNLLFFLPFFSEAFAENYLATTALWFKKFEFNASFYYLVRWIGYQMEGYNIIALAGPLLAFLTFTAVLALAFFRRNIALKELLVSMLLAITVYFLMATTVHPWYLATPLLLSIFTRYRFMLLWSFTVILSYFAYSHIEFQENLWLVALEYLIVIPVIGWELVRARNKISVNVL